MNTRRLGAHVRSQVDDSLMKMPSASLQRWSSRILEGLWLTTAIAIPLVLNPWGSNVFELPKAALLKALVLLMLLVRLIRAIEARNESGRPLFPLPLRSAVWPVIALALALTLATLLSVSPRASLWGSYERQQGLLTWGAYLVLFLLISTGLRTRAQIERLWVSLVWGSVLVVAYGLVQVAGLDPLDWRTDAVSPILSTIGRPNFVGSYLVLMLPLTLGRTLLVRRRWPYLLLLVGQLVCIALTQARGAWLGMAAAVVGFGAIWAIITHNRRLAMVTLALVVLAVGFVAVLNLPSGPLAPLAHPPLLDRLATLTQTDAGSTAARLTIWRATLPLAAARPWLGYGPETMRPVFQGAFPPQLVYYQGRHAVVDRAHNLWLDLGMSAGLAGVLAFGALLVGLGWMVWYGLRRSSTRWDRLAWTALAASIIGHLADLQFSFDLTASATVFWLVLAMATTLWREQSVPPLDQAPASRQAWLLLYLPLVVVGLVLVGLLCVRPLWADIAYKKSQSAGSPAERVSWGERSIRLWPLEPEYHMGLAWNLMQEKDWAAAETELARAGALSPDDPYVWLAKGELYANWARAGSGQYVLAEAAYRQAMELAPNVAAYHTALGLVLVQQDRIQEGLAELERAVDLDATDSMAYTHLADLYQILGREADARWARQEAIRWSEE